MTIDSTSSDEHYVQLLVQHERELRAFIRSTGLDWSAVDDVIQTVSLVMWRKWNEFDPESDFLRWARVIARLEILKYRRSLARDRHVFNEEIISLLASAAEESGISISSQEHRSALAKCMENLPPKSRQLIHTVYQGNSTIRQIAEQAGSSATAMYKKLNRIRVSLEQCIRTRVESTGA